MRPVHILGATGLVGQTCLALLATQKWPFQIGQLVASQPKVNHTFQSICNWQLPNPMPKTIAQQRLAGISEIPDHSYIISCLPSDVALDIEPKLLKRGCIISSNASCQRLAEDTPLIIPTINASILANYPQTHLIKNTNCIYNNIGFIKMF